MKIRQPARTFSVFYSVSYDPITLEYNQDTDGETLKYMDDIVKWKVIRKNQLTNVPFLYFFLRHVCYRPSCGLLRWLRDLMATVSIHLLGNLYMAHQNHPHPNRLLTW